MLDIRNSLEEIVGEAYLVAGKDAQKWSSDWIGSYHWSPLAVVRPASTQEVSAVVKACSAAGVAMVPVGGNTGLAGGTAGRMQS